MSEIFRTILIMSLSGSILALLLMVGKPLYRNKLHQSFQYYLWLVVLAVLLLPVSKLVQVPADSALPAFQPFLNELVTQNVMTSDELAVYLAQMQAANTVPTRDGAVVDRMGQSGRTAMSDKTSLSEWMIFLYPLGVGIVLLYNLLTYQFFCIRLKRSSALTSISSPIPVYQSNMAKTPMLVGIFHPQIYLPKREFTKSQLEGVLRHEMVHFRRKDILIKWLSVLTCAVHWFNPIVWLTRREISRACELSCDEAVITGLDAAGRQMYGDTLILVAADDHRVRPTLAMGEDKRELKERLANIMKRKKHTRFAVTILVGLLTISAAAVTVLGAGSQENEAQKQTDQVQTDQLMLDRDQSIEESTESTIIGEESTDSASIEPETQAADSIPSETDENATDTDETIQDTKYITMWFEGMPEEILAFLSISNRYNYGIYLPADYEFSELPDGDWIKPTEASGIMPEINMMIRPMEEDETVPEDIQEGGMITQYRMVELSESTLLISIHLPVEAVEGGGAMLRQIADTIFDPFQTLEE